MWLKQSTAKVVSFGPFVANTDGVTLVTTLVSAIDHATTGIKLSKNGSAFAIRHQSVTASTYDAHGNYLVTLDTTDTNTLGTLRMQWEAAATNMPVWRDFLVLPANIYDSLVSGSDVLDISVIQWLGTAVAAPTVAGIPQVELAGVLAAAVRAFMDTTRAAELTALPSKTVPSYSDMVAFLYERTRNVMTETATTEILKKADGTTTLGTATNSDDGTTFTRGAMA